MGVGMILELTLLSSLFLLRSTTVFLLRENWSNMKNKITRTGNDTHSERRGFWVDDLAEAAAFAIRRVCTMLILATEQETERNNVRLC